MNSLDLVSSLIRQMEWADAKLWTAVLQSAAATHDGAVRDRLYHIHLVQRSFLAIWRGEIERLDWKEGIAGRDLLAWGRGTIGEIQTFVSGLSGAALDRDVQLPWAERITSKLGAKPVVPTLGETLVQVATHSAYHRGQVNARLRELGTEPPLIDFIAWVWLGKPAPAWPGE